MNTNYKLWFGSSCKIMFILILAVSFGLSAFAQLDPENAVPKYEIPDLKYPTADAFVVTYNIMDYGADNTGVEDNSNLIIALLRKMEATSSNEGGVGNGGVLFLPEGKYRVERSIVVPKGITIRGEWEKPVKGQPIRGTIITTTFGRGTENEQRSLFKLEPAAAIKDVAFWYPEQIADNITPYPPTIIWGRENYFGNEYCVAQNVTFINSYSGIVFPKANPGGAPNAFGLYGTPLKRGVEIDYIAEVGRLEGVDFSPEYWIGSGLPGSPSSSFKSWVKKNGTAIVMRRNDWTFVSNVNVEGYNVGFHAVKSEKDGSKPNGQNYKMTFTDCTTGIYAEDPQTSGIMFHEIKTVDCDYGLFVPNYASGVLQFSKCDFAAKKYAIASDSQSSTRIMLNQCVVSSGKVETLGGTLVMMDSDFNNEAPQVKLGPDSRAILTGNRFKEEVDIVNNSMYECQIDHSPLEEDFKRIAEFPYKDPQEIKQRPDRTALYVVTSEEFGARNDGVTDNTQAIQKALDKAAADGGGIVYLPAGKYKVTGNLVVPTGVEIKGAMDVGTPPIGPGSILEVYADKGNEHGEPFMKLSEKSGIRGISFNYPEQKFTDIKSGSNLEPHKYPYCLQVTGKDVYIVNVGLRATYSGIDLFTHKCDEAYVEYLAGHIFKYGVRVGNGSENIRINNTQFNTIGYACGGETKFGVWPNSPIDRPSSEKEDNMPAYRQNYRDVEFFILGDCKNLMLLNNFVFGCYKGYVFADDGQGPSGIGVGQAIDAGIKAFYYEKLGEGGFDLIGTQIVALKDNVVGEPQSVASFIETAEGFTGKATLFSIDLWGEPYYGVRAGGGELDLQFAHFDNPGSVRFAEIEGDGILSLWGCSVKPRGSRPINEGMEGSFFAESSLIDAGNIIQEDCGKYIFNLSDSPVFSMTSQIDRSGWTATASHNNYSSRNAIDGDTSSRWDIGRGQDGGEWIAIDMQEPQTFNKIILDQGTSSGDYPRGYEIYLSDDGADWGEPVLIGQGTGTVTTINLPETVEKRHLKIVQTGKASSTYWSIHELYIAEIEEHTIEDPLIIEEIEGAKVVIYYANGYLHVEGLSGNANIVVYDMKGRIVNSLKNVSDKATPIQLPKGMYIFSLEIHGKTYNRKIVIN